MVRTETREGFHASWTLQVRTLADAKTEADAAADGKGMMKKKATEKKPLTAEERKAANGWHSCVAGMCAPRPKAAPVQPASEPAKPEGE